MALLQQPARQDSNLSSELQVGRGSDGVFWKEIIAGGNYLYLERKLVTCDVNCPAMFKMTACAFVKSPLRRASSETTCSNGCCNGLNAHARSLGKLI